MNFTCAEDEGKEAQDTIHLAQGHTTLDLNPGSPSSCVLAHLFLGVRKNMV